MSKFKYAINLFVIFTAINVSILASAANIDPTKPFGQGVASLNNDVVTNKLVLQSIIHGDDLHTAVINGKIVKPGEFIGQYRVVAVNDVSVVLRSDDERIKLYVFKQSIIK